MFGIEYYPNGDTRIDGYEDTEFYEVRHRDQNVVLGRIAREGEANQGQWVLRTVNKKIFLDKDWYINDICDRLERFLTYNDEGMAYFSYENVEYR